SPVAVKDRLSRLGVSEAVRGLLPTAVVAVEVGELEGGGDCGPVRCGPVSRRGRSQCCLVCLATVARAYAAASASLIALPAAQAAAISGSSALARMGATAS